MCCLRNSDEEKARVTTEMISPITSKAALLQALDAGEAHGAELVDRIYALTEGDTFLHDGSVYPTLKSLLKDGLIKQVKSRKKNMSRKKTFRLTSKGKRQVKIDKNLARGIFGLK